ncbi:hypothetical protein [Mycolicibacterium helvum]|uniref:hypothetical protein n=1 Tax=Mycolicibacterium helvum TaxID=1534349 RepID=UPI0031EF103E
MATPAREVSSVPAPRTVHELSAGPPHPANQPSAHEQAASTATATALNPLTAAITALSDAIHSAVVHISAVVTGAVIDVYIIGVVIIFQILGIQFN